MLCCFCDNPSVDNRPGAPLCAECWERCERKAREAKPATSEVFLNAEGLLVREAQRLASDPRSAGFVGVAAIGGAPKGTTVQ
jgi:hypothetical protein